tara:strand:+ start:6823 stop:7626 length:804 start_codon:yes stop_codon:yes gene_type:complete
MGDIQETDVEEQVEETTLNFGQGEQDTQDTSEGQVEQAVWNEDKRYKDHWGEDPNKMYETLRYQEKRQGDYDTKIKDFTGQVEELNHYKNDYETLEKLMEHPVLGEKLLSVIQEHQQGNQQQGNQQQENQGTTEGQGQQVPHSNEVNELMDWKNNLEKQAEDQYYSNQKDEQLSQIANYAKEFNIKYDKDDFLNAMKGSNVSPESWVHYFKSHVSDIALKNAKNKAAEQALSTRNQMYSSSSSSDKGLSSLNGLTVDQALDRALNIN